MITAIKTEVLKIRTSRLALGLLAGAAAWTAMVATIESSRSGPGGIVPSLATEAGLRAVLASTGFAAILGAVFGVTVSSGEFRHRTATDTYLDDPNRRRVLAAKVVTAALTGLLFGLVGSAITTGVGLFFTAARGYSIALTTETIAGYVLGAVIGAGILAAAGAALGSLIRSQLAAIVVVFAWAFGIEQIIGGVSKTIAAYLPFAAAGTMSGGTSKSMPPLPPGLNPLPFGAAVALLAAVTFLLAALAARNTIRRDIS
jgi:ABC-2 type transport system permease protein